MPQFISRFPFKTIRVQQHDILETLEEAWDDFDYFVLEVPTGGGKSAIARAVTAGVTNAFLLTATKQLQDQYIKDFPEMISLKGRANYQCAKLPKLNVENGLCAGNPGIVKNCRRAHICHYYNQRDKAIAANTTLTSYAYFFYSTFCGDFWEHRDLTIYDEAHLIESQIVSWSSLHLIPEDLRRQFGLAIKPRTWTDGYAANRDIVMEIYKQIAARRDELFKEISETLAGQSANSLTEDDVDDIITAHHEYYSIDKLAKQMEVFAFDPHKGNWLIKALDNNEGLLITPLRTSEIFSRLVAPWATKHIFMSATILDVEAFAKELGLPEEKTAVIRVDSEFSPKKSPIRFWPVGKMTYKELPETLPRIVNAVSKILAEHPHDKGIVHTGTYAIAGAIYDGLDNPRLIRKEEGETNEQLLLRHIESSEPTVILSPSLTTGADLLDALSRFQVIVKLPWLSLADSRTAKKAEMDPQWYQAEMLRTLVQAAGRSTRTKDDWAVTYVLDEKLKFWIGRSQQFIPKQFQRRIDWSYGRQKGAV